jgi:hypothetical protein
MGLAIVDRFQEKTIGGDRLMGQRSSAPWTTTRPSISSPHPVDVCVRSSPYRCQAEQIGCSRCTSARIAAQKAQSSHTPFYAGAAGSSFVSTAPFEP